MSKDVKLLAKNFSQKAKDLGLKLSHSQSLELLAFSKGFADWNAYSANLKTSNDIPVINANLDPIFQISILKICFINDKFRDDFLSHLKTDLSIHSNSLFSVKKFDDIFSLIVKSSNNHESNVENFVRSEIKKISSDEQNELSSLLDQLLAFPLIYDINYYINNLNQHMTHLKMSNGLKNAKETWSKKPQDSILSLTSTISDIKNNTLKSQSHQTLELTKEVQRTLFNCLKMVASIEKDGGLSSSRLDNISNQMNESADTLNEYFNDAVNLNDKLTSIELSNFFVRFQKSNLNVFHFLINEEDFYIVANTVAKAEALVKKQLPQDGIEIESISFVELLTEAKLKELTYYEEFQIDELSFLEKLSQMKEDAPYIFAQNLI